jgi:Domain of unknown function (DUF4276)
VRIGLLVDGHAELAGLPGLFPRIKTPHQLLKPLRCDIQPFATPAQMALVASKQFPILLRRKVDKIVLLIDKETRAECTVELVRAIERAARARLANLSPGVDLHVVLKVSMLENWLIADPQALRELPKLIENPERIAKQVSGGRADAVDALALLKACWGKGFKKPECAVAICQKIEPTRAAENSRSFRKLLKTLGHPDYAEPASPAQARARRSRKPTR